MIASTKLLFRLIRMRLAVGMSAAFVLFLILALFQPPLDKEYGPLLLVVGMVLILPMRLHLLLDDNMFPVTDRQVAWIPMAAWGLTTLAGAVGLLLGQVFVAIAGGKIPFYDIASYWFPLARLTPAILFLLLIMWRFGRMNAGFWGFMGFLPSILMPRSLTPQAIEFYLAGWPVWALGCVFLVWEAPRQTAVLRRMDYQESGSGFFKARTLRLDGPARLTWPTRLADLLGSVVLVVVCVLVFIHVVFAPADQIRRNPFLLFFLFLLLIPIGWLVNGWRRNRASGMEPGRASIVLLVKMTGVGYLFRDLMGVTKGSVARCAFCGGWRMVWQTKCPACGDTRPAIVKGEKDGSPGMGRFYLPRHDPGAIAYRVFIPLYLLFGIIVSNWSHWFGG